MKRFLMVGLVALVATGCGSDSNLTGPSSGIPNVAGNYRGTTTISYPELSATVTCDTSTSVTQGTGGSINLAPLQLGGECAQLGLTSIPLGATSIDSTGALASESGTSNATCGVYSYSMSGGFFGRDLRVSGLFNSNSCYDFNITINLTRS
jgi:hypothetical protein